MKVKAGDLKFWHYGDEVSLVLVLEHAADIQGEPDLYAPETFWTVFGVLRAVGPAPRTFIAGERELIDIDSVHSENSP